MQQETFDFYLANYVYYFSNGTQKGEGNLYLATNAGAGVRKANIDLARETVRSGLEETLETPVVVVIQTISYLATCTKEDFEAPQTQSNEA